MAITQQQLAKAQKGTTFVLAAQGSKVTNDSQAAKLLSFDPMAELPSGALTIQPVVLSLLVSGLFPCQVEKTGC